MIFLPFLLACFAPDKGDPIVVNFSTGTFGIYLPESIDSVDCSRSDGSCTQPDVSSGNGDQFITVHAESGPLTATIWTSEATLLWTAGFQLEYDVVTGGWGDYIADPSQVDNSLVWADGLPIYPLAVCQNNDDAWKCTDFRK